MTLKLFFDFFFRPTDPPFRVEGDGKRNILLGWPNVFFRNSVLNSMYYSTTV